MADAKTVVWDSGLYQKATTLDITSAALANGAGEDITITTGAGNDTVTLTASSWVGAAGAGGTKTISTRAGDDTITVTAGQLLANTTDEYAVITAGKGCLLYTSPSPRDQRGSRMPSSA